MRIRIAGAVGALPLLMAAAGAEFPVSTAEVKCGVTQAVFLVDGELDDAGWRERVSGLDAHYALVACWNPRDSTLSLREPGIPVYEILTKAFVEGITTRLVQIERAQRERFERRGSFTDDLSELGLAHLQSEGVEIVVTAAADGWSATATRGLMVHRCSVEGRAADPSPEGEDGAARCVFDSGRKVALPEP